MPRRPNASDVSLFLAALVFSALSLGLLGMRGVPGLVLAALGAGVGLLTHSRPRLGTQTLLFLLPCLGAVDNVFPKSQAIPFLLGPLAGWLSASGVLLLKSERAKPLPKIFAAGLLVLFLLALIPSLEALFRYVSLVWPRLDVPLIDRDAVWNHPLKLKNALGWVLLGFVVLSGGWLTAVFFLKEIPVRLSFAQILVPLFLGLLPSVALGLVQIATPSGFLSAAAFAGSGRINGAFIDPNAFAMSLCLFLPWSAGALWEWRRADRPEKKPWWIAGGIVTASLAVLMFFTGTRSVFVAMAGGFAALAACAFFRMELRRPVLRSGLFGIVLVAALAAASWVARFPVVDRMADAAAALTSVPASVDGWRHIRGGRWAIWERAWHLIRRRPWTGGGVGTYIIEGRMDKSRPSLPTVNDNAGSHYLQVWQETGLAGLAAFLLFAALTLSRGLRAVRSDPGPRRAFVLAGYAGMLAALAFGGHLLRLEVNLLFWLSAVLLWREEPA